MNSWMKVLGVVLTLALAVPFVACGDDSSDGSGEGEGEACSAVCDSSEADIEGEWTLSSSCPSSAEVPGIIDELQMTCPDATGSATGTVTGGSLSVSGGNYTSMLSLTLEFDVTVPLSCLGGGTCEALQAEFGSTATCTEANEACNCTDTVQTEVEDTGTWTLSGSTLTLTDGDGETSDHDVCVSGNTFSFHSSEEEAAEGAPVYVYTK